MRFRKKPVEIEAVQFRYGEWADTPETHAFFSEIPEWLHSAFQKNTVLLHFRSEDYWYCVIRTLEGDMSATPGDWIIRGVKGELYPCKPDIFEATYEAVDGEGEGLDLSKTVQG